MMCQVYYLMHISTKYKFILLQHCCLLLRVPSTSCRTAVVLVFAHSRVPGTPNKVCVRVAEGTCVMEAIYYDRSETEEHVGVDLSVLKSDHVPTKSNAVAS